MTREDGRDTGAYLSEAVRYFRAFGFFQNERHLPDDALIARIKAYLGSDWEEYVGTAQSRPAADCWLLTADTSRVWLHDLECVYRGEDCYARTLHDWAAISRGVFTPTEITETWVSDRGPVHVTFSFGGRQHTYVHADGHDDFINLQIIRMINQLLGGIPQRFEACDDVGDCRCIVVLTRDEKARLKRERGWDFCDFLSP